MHCQKASEFMSLRLDGRLTADEKASLEQHITQCAACAEEWRSMLSVAALFADVEIAEPSPRLQARVMRRVRHHEFRARLARGMGLSLIGLLALIGMGLLVMVGAWSVAVGNSSLGHAIVLVATQFANTLRTIVRAVGLMSQAALGGPIGLVVLAGLVITGMLTVQWLRMLSRPMTSRA